MSSLSASPKQPHRVTRYTPNLQRTLAANAAAAASPDGQVDPAALEEPPADWMALISLMLGVLGLMMRYKLCAWLALFACMSSVMTMRKKDRDVKQIFCSGLFAVMSVVMSYFGVRNSNGPSSTTGGPFSLF